MHQPHLVDIILPTFDGCRFLREAVESVQRQTFTAWRLLIIDNGSSDCTLQVARNLSRADARVHVSLEPEGRAVNARMAAADRSDAPILAFIDQDDRWLPSKLARQIASLRQHRFDAVHTAVRHIDQLGVDIPGAAWEENRYRTRHLAGPGGATASALCVRSSVRLASSMVRRDAFNNVGGFDSSLNGGEDWSFWFDLVASGHRLGYLDEVLTERRVHGSNTSVIQRADRRHGLDMAADRMLRKHPEYERWIAARRAIVSCGTAVELARSGRLSSATVEMRRAIRAGREGPATEVLRYGFDSSLRAVTTRLARARMAYPSPTRRP